jgi:hypothetical protein
MYEMIGKLKKTKKIKFLMSQLQKENFTFNTKHIQGTGRQELSEKLTEIDCALEIRKAVEVAEKDCERIGINCNEATLQTRRANNSIFIYLSLSHALCSLILGQARIGQLTFSPEQSRKNLSQVRTKN